MPFGAAGLNRSWTGRPCSFIPAVPTLALRMYSMLIFSRPTGDIAMRWMVVVAVVVVVALWAGPAQALCVGSDLWCEVETLFDNLIGLGGIAAALFVFVLLMLVRGASAQRRR